MGTQARRNNLELTGIRVVDLTSMWAGPLCTRILADLGAEVIKIELRARPDGTRSNPGFFSWLNWNKLGITMDLSLDQSRECFKQLVARSDVVVENFSPRVMANFNLDYPALKEVKADIIMLSMPAYGSTGPYANYVAYGPGLEASSGLSALTGYRDGPPTLTGSAYGDPVAGLHGVVAVLGALRHRRRSGTGQWIDLSQREALSQMFGEAFVKAAKGIRELRSGNLRSDMSPHDCYRCRGEDRWIAIAVRTDEEWRRLCETMGCGWLADDPRYLTLEARKANQEQLDREIESWTRQMDAHEAVRLLQEARLAASVVNNARDLVEDTHLAERGFFQRGIDLEGRACDFPGLPWRASGASRNTGHPAPQLGEHNREVLGGLLGLSEAQIEELQGAMRWDSKR